MAHAEDPEYVRAAVEHYQSQEDDEADEWTPAATGWRTEHEQLNRIMALLAVVAGSLGAKDMQALADFPRPRDLVAETLAEIERRQDEALFTSALQQLGYHTHPLLPAEA